MVRSRARLRITLKARRTGHFMRAGVALTNTADKLMRRRERERDVRQNESEKQKKRSKVGGKNNLKL